MFLIISCYSRSSTEDLIHRKNERYWIVNNYDTIGKAVWLFYFNKNNDELIGFIGRDNTFKMPNHDDIVLEEYWKLIKKDTINVRGLEYRVEKLNRDTLFISHVV